ncbi:ABC transporter permease [Paracoccus sp. S-4012]|uniref:cell division protein FtsX n=1 Tax=Paracoccus sp. S-4012 TaxID=2665648 RepID=UPI001E2BCA22|nr:cell division protein FtsX [Paracoccus sp. S-4012]
MVPRTGATAMLVLLTSGAMAFLAVFALALTFATGRLADRWAEGLARTMTIRITAPQDVADAEARRVLDILAQTPGVAEARTVSQEEMQELLLPWFGPDMPVDALPIPRLVELTLDGGGPDVDNLELRLEGEVPDAVLDDHTRWREPLVTAATRLRSLGWMSLGLIAVTAAGMISLAAQASLAANGGVIRVLRLIGARDLTIAGAFVRRFTRRAALGALGGALLGMLAIAALPDMDQAGTFLTGLGFTGASWLWPLLIPVFAAGIAFLATRRAAIRRLREIP